MVSAFDVRSAPPKRPVVKPARPPRCPIALNGSRRLLTAPERECRCAACGGDLWHDHAYWVLSCGHIYHKECLGQLFADESHTCAACATPLFVLSSE
jgi:hypothetical protein